MDDEETTYLIPAAIDVGYDPKRHRIVISFEAYNGGKLPFGLDYNTAAFVAEYILDLVAVGEARAECDGECEDSSPVEQEVRRLLGKDSDAPEF